MKKKNSIQLLSKEMKDYERERKIKFTTLLKKILKNKNELHISTYGYQRYDEISGDWIVEITNNGLILKDILPLLELKKKSLIKLIDIEKKAILDKINNIDKYIKEKEERNKYIKNLLSDNGKNKDVFFENENNKKDINKSKIVCGLKLMYNFLDKNDYFEMKKDKYYMDNYIKIKKELKATDEHLDVVEYKNHSPIFGSQNEISIFIEDEKKFEKQFINNYLGKGNIYIASPVIESLNTIENNIEMYNKILKENRTKNIEYIKEEKEEKEKILSDIKEINKDFIEKKEMGLEGEEYSYYLAKDDKIETLENICIDKIRGEYDLDEKNIKLLEEKGVYLDIKYMNYKKELI